MRDEDLAAIGDPEFMVLPMVCARCHAVFEVVRPTDPRIVCPQCAESESDKPDCPICHSPKAARKQRGRRPVLCGPCAKERATMSSRLAHKHVRQGRNNVDLGTRATTAALPAPADATPDEAADHDPNATFRMGQRIVRQPW